VYDPDYIKNSAIDTDMGVKHHFSDDIYAKELHIPKGHVALGHRHTYSHLSLLGKGVCKLSREIDGVLVETKHTAPAVLDIKAGVEHQVEALEDVVWFCVHATTEKDPAKIDEVAIGAPAH